MSGLIIQNCTTANDQCSIFAPLRITIYLLLHQLSAVGADLREVNIFSTIALKFGIMLNCLLTCNLQDHHPKYHNVVPLWESLKFMMFLTLKIVPAKIGCRESYIPVSNAFYQIWYLGTKVARAHTHIFKFDQSFKPKVVGWPVHK